MKRGPKRGTKVVKYTVAANGFDGEATAANRLWAIIDVDSKKVVAGKLTLEDCRELYRTLREAFEAAQASLDK